ncbi:MAG TPA: adenosine deaminase [Ktedonobacterales bacterium]|jgi:adenosine deaminase
MKSAENLAAYLRAAPKAELHVHLEGSIQPATLLKLAERNGAALPAQDVDGLRQWFTYRDFDHFIEIYFAIIHCLKTAEDYELIAYEFGAEMARQHVRYAEVTFSPSSHYYMLGLSHETYFGGLTRGRERARADFDVEMRWVFDIVRSTPGEALRRDLADYTTNVAIASMGAGVVALGLGGGEVGFPPEDFAPWFAQARKAGLHSTPHAGETVGPGSVWGALQALGAERIGHGVRSIEDPALVQHLAQQQIPLEVCPTSNLRLGVSPSYAEHPLPRLYAAGVPLTINSDDPPLFNTTLNHEVALLAEPFRFDLATINNLLLNGARHSFLPPGEKRALEEQFREEMHRLQGEMGLL